MDHCLALLMAGLESFDSKLVCHGVSDHQCGVILCAVVHACCWINHGRLVFNEFLRWVIVSMVFTLSLFRFATSLSEAIWPMDLAKLHRQATLNRMFAPKLSVMLQQLSGPRSQEVGVKLGSTFCPACFFLF